MKPVSCPGCIYSGQSHLAMCENSKLERELLNALNKTYHWKELTKVIFELSEDEVPIVTAYVNRVIESRPKGTKVVRDGL